MNMTATPLTFKKTKNKKKNPVENPFRSCFPTFVFCQISWTDELSYNHCQRCTDLTQTQGPAVCTLNEMVPGPLMKRKFSSLVRVFDDFLCDWNQSNHTVLESNTHLEYKSIHFSSLVFICHLSSPSFIFLAAFFVKLPSDKKGSCVSYLALPRRRDLSVAVRPSDTMTVRRMSGKGTNTARWREKKRNSLQQPDIGSTAWSVWAVYSLNFNWRG